MDLSVKLPSYVKTALSAWLSRGITIGCKLLAIPLLLQFLRREDYAALVILGSLEGWFLLFDFGIGASLQNYLSESRAKGISDRALIYTAFVFGLISLAFGILFLWGISPFFSEFLFERVLFPKEALAVFLIGGLCLVMGTFGSLAYKILMARHLGFVVYLLQGIGSLLSLLLLFGWTFYSKLSLMTAVFFVLGMPSCISFIVAVFIFSRIKWKDPICWDLIFRAKNFFLFSLLAALVTLSDAFIVPRTLKIDEVIEYNLLCKVFGVASFAYSAFLQGLWPECSELLASYEFAKVQLRIRKCCFFSILGICLFTVFVWAFSGVIEKNLLISFKTSCILLFCFYLCIRVVSDFYAMALQSHSKLSPFFYLVPIQACFSVFFQYTLSNFFGIAGIILGLSLSYLLTVFWALPRQLNFLAGESALLRKGGVDV